MTASPNTPNTPDRHDIEQPPPAGAGNAWSRAAAASASSRPKKRGPWRAIFGVAAALLVVVAVLVVLAPTLLRGYVANEAGRMASAQIAGSVEVGSVDLSWTGSTRATGVRLLDPSGAEVASVSAEVDLGLLDLLLGPSGVVTVTVTGNADLVSDDTGDSNLSRAIAPAPSAQAPTGTGQQPGPGTPTPGGTTASNEPATWPEGLDVDLIFDGVTVSVRQQSTGSGASDPARAVLGEPIAMTIERGRVGVGPARGASATMDLLIERAASGDAAPGGGVSGGGAARLPAGRVNVQADAPGLIAPDGTIDSDTPMTARVALDAVSSPWIAGIAGALVPDMTLGVDDVREALGETIDSAWDIELDASRVTIAGAVEGRRLSARDVRVRLPRAGLLAAGAERVSLLDGLEARGTVEADGLSVALIDAVARADGWLVEALGDTLSGEIDVAGFDAGGGGDGAGALGSGTATVRLETPRASITAALEATASEIVAVGEPEIRWTTPTPAALDRLASEFGVLLSRADPGTASGPITVTARGLRVPRSGALAGITGVIEADLSGWTVGSGGAPALGASPQSVRMTLAPAEAARVELASALVHGAPFTRGAGHWTRDAGSVTGDLRFSLPALLGASESGDPNAWHAIGARGTLTLERVTPGLLIAGAGLGGAALPLPDDEIRHLVGNGLSATLAFEDNAGVLGLTGEAAAQRVALRAIDATFDSTKGSIDAGADLTLTRVDAGLLDRLAQSDGWVRDLVGASLTSRLRVTLRGDTENLERADASVAGQVTGDGVVLNIDASMSEGAVRTRAPSRATWTALSPEARERIASIAGVRVSRRTDAGEENRDLVVELSDLRAPVPLALGGLAGRVQVWAPASELRMSAAPVEGAGSDDEVAEPDPVAGWVASLGVRTPNTTITLAPGQPVEISGRSWLVQHRDAGGAPMGIGTLAWSGSVDDWLDQDGAINTETVVVRAGLTSDGLRPSLFGSAAVALGAAPSESALRIDEAFGSSMTIDWQAGWGPEGLTVRGEAGSTHATIRTLDASVARAGFEDRADPLSHARASAEIVFDRMPSGWLDTLTNADGWLADIAGPWVSGTVSVRSMQTDPDPARTRGTVVLGFESPTSRFDAELIAREGWLTAAGQPVLVWHTLTEAGSDRIRQTGDVFSVLSKSRAVDEPARLTLTSLRVPLDFDLSAAQATLNVAAGDVRFRFSERLSRWIRDSRPVLGADGLPISADTMDVAEVPVRPERFEPFDVVLADGRVRFADAEFPVGENVVTARGAFDLVERTERLSLRVPARIVNLPQFDESVWTRAASQGAQVRFVREGPLGEASWGTPEPMFDVEKAVEGAVREQLNDVIRRGLEDLLNRDRGNDGDGGGG